MSVLLFPHLHKAAGTGKALASAMAVPPKQREPCAMALWDLPNANSAEWWITKAAETEATGDIEASPTLSHL